MPCFLLARRTFCQIRNYCRIRNYWTTQDAKACIILAGVLLHGFLLLSPTPTHAQIAKAWNTGSGSWSTPINWAPNGVPAFNDGAFIGTFASAENATVFLDIDDTVASVNITDGMSLQTQGNTLLVNGDTTISGSNTVPSGGGGNIIHTSRITLIRGTNPDDYDTDNLTVTDGGTVRLLDGAILEVDDTLNVDIDSSVRGEGVIRLTGTGTVYVNSGALDPFRSGMTIDVTNGGAIDLDGSSGNGRVLLSGAQIDGSAFDNLTINGGTITDPFGGEIRLTANSFLAMNIDAPWSTSSNSEIRVFGSPTHPGPAIISGADLTIGGELNVSGSDAHGQIDADVTFASSTNVIIGTNDLLDLTGVIDIEGGEYTIEDGGRIDFQGPTILRGGTFTSNTDFPAFDTSVSLHGETTYRGEVTFTGNTRQFGEATVAATTVINAEVFDMSGVMTTWNVNATATINADRVEGGFGPNPSFNGIINISGGLTSRLIINLTDPDEAWVMGGTLNLNGNAIFFTNKLGGSAVSVTGDVNVNGRAGVAADASFTDTSTLDFANANAEMLLSGRTLIAASTTITGDGTLENRAAGDMSLAAGLSTGQVGLRNQGLLKLGDELGVVSVDRFESFADSTLVADVGKSDITTDNDVLTVSSGAADVAGFVQPNIVNIGGIFEPPEIGDSFTILTAVSGVNGTFDDVLDSNLGGEVYEWSITHNPSNVVIELAAISGLLGDYNQNGTIDAPDYTVWLDTLGSEINLAADGNLNGVIDQGDYDFWKANFGAVFPGVGLAAAVPEPATLVLFLTACIFSMVAGSRERPS